MINRFGRHSKKKIVTTGHSNDLTLNWLVFALIAIAAIFAVVTLGGYSSHIFVYFPDRTTVFWLLEPSRR